MAETVGPTPTRVKRRGDGLAADWTDGVSTHVTFRKLRAACPCATCEEARSKPADPFRVLSDREAMAGPPEPTTMVPKGRYAYQIVWNDGHDTGIYPVGLIRKLSTIETT